MENKFLQEFREMSASDTDNRESRIGVMNYMFGWMKQGVKSDTLTLEEVKALIKAYEQFCEEKK